MIADGLQGGQVLTAYARIETLGWLVFVEQPLGEAFAPLQASIVRSVILFALALVLSVLASVLLGPADGRANPGIAGRGCPDRRG